MELQIYIVMECLKHRFNQGKEGKRAALCVAHRCSNCRLLKFRPTLLAYLPRSRHIRLTYPTIAPRKLPLWGPQKFPIISYTKVSPGAA